MGDEQLKVIDLYEPEKLPPLRKTAEIMDMRDGDSAKLIITDWEAGRMTIHPRYPGAPKSKIICGLRLYLQPETKTIGPPYFVLTSKTLIESLTPYLERPDFDQKLYTITKYGVEPKARFELEVEPLPIKLGAREKLYMAAKEQIRTFYPRTWAAEARLKPETG